MSNHRRPKMMEWLVAPAALVAVSLFVLLSPTGAQRSTIGVKKIERQGTASNRPAAESLVAQNEFYVATNGNDSNPGTFAQPFLTLDRARLAVRGENASMNSDITVYIRGGRYQLSNTLAFDEADSGTNGSNVVYRRYQNEAVTISGGVQVTGFTLHSGSIYKADVGTNRFRQFYVEDARGIRAREPDLGYHSLVSWNGTDGINFTSGEIVGSWARLTNAEVAIQKYWNNNYFRLSSVSGTNAHFQTPEGPLAYVQAFPIRENGQKYHVENALELLDSDGEWYINTDDNKVYYQLRAGELAGSIVAYRPALERLIQIKGSALGTNAKFLKFYGITFEHSTWLYPNTNGAVWDQANIVFEEALPVDQLTSYPGTRVPGAIYIENANNITFERCKFRHLGATAIEGRVAVTDSTFVGNQFRDIAASAIVIDDNLEGANSVDSRKVCARNTIKNNYFDTWGQDYWDGEAVVVGYGDATLIEHNEFTNGPHTCISVGWGWTTTANVMQNNHIAYNWIHNITSKLADSGTIYTLSDQEGTVIEENFIDTVSRAATAQSFLHNGVMLDEGSCRITVVNNVMKSITDGNLRQNSPCSSPGNTVGSCCLSSDAGIEANAGIESAYQPSLGLVAAYGFEEGLGATTGDASGNGHIGTLTNGPTWVAGQSGGGLALDGSNDYVSVADSDSLALGGTDFTVAGWIKRGSVGTEDTLLSKTAPGGWVTGGKQIFISGVNNRLCLQSFGAAAVCSTGAITADGLWHYVAVPFNDSNNAVGFFLDGIPSGSGTLDLGPDIDGHVVKIGANDPQYLHGQIDELRIYNRALNQSGVQSIMNAPVSPTVVPVSMPDVSGAPGSNVTIPITVSDLTGLGVRAYDLQVTFDPLIVQPQATPFDNAGTLSSGMSITPNATNAGHLIISAFQATDLSGSGTLLKLKFNVVGSPAQTTSLAFQDYTDPNTIFHPSFRFNAGNPQASTTNGSITVNTAPTITSSPVTRQAGSPGSNSTVATVSDIESGASGVTVAVTSANPSNGVTVSSIVNTNGTVTADVVAACGATAASFTLTATDGGGATATATLNVTVNPNTAPTLVYSSPQSVIFGGSLDVTPTTATDNGSITGYNLQSVVPALTTAPTVNSSGVVSVTNAQPSGSHIITIRVTDNCGLTTEAQFTLDVGAAPSFAIDDVTDLEGNAGTTSFTFTVTKTGSTALTATVDYATVDGTATSPSDFTAIPTTTLTFLPADTTKQFTVLVNGDTTFEPDETFTVHLSNASAATISDADGTGTIINDDSPSISGRVLYADTVTPGRNVTMTLTAPSFTTRTTTTDANGDYTFVGVPPGNDYTVTPSKTGDVNGLESLDASDTARYVAGLALPSGNQRIAADADGDGILTSFDASLIARYVVGLPGAGIVGTWKFVPVSRSYPALSGDQSSQNSTAILVGDTGGNWTPSLPLGGASDNSQSFASASAPLAASVGSSSLSPAGTVTVSVSVPDLAAPPGANVSIPIAVSDLTGLVVRAYDLQITFNPLIVQPQATPYDNAGTLSSGMSITPNTTNAGHLIISAFQASDLSGSGTLLKIKFTVVGAPPQVTPLTFEDYTDPNPVFHPGFRFNAGNPQASTTNGSLLVHVPTAAPATISGRITTPDGAPLAGVVINLSGSESRKTITDANGNYRFDSVDTGNFYTVTPSRMNYHFDPDNRSFSLLAEMTDAVFTATPDAVIVGNVIETPEYFVRQHYLDFLGREPDEAGFNFWSNQMLECGADAGCLERRRVNVSAAYFLSIEFQETGGLVDGLYRASYGRRPLFAEFMPDTATVARDVVVGRAGWAQLLESNKQAFVDAWVQRPAFRIAYDGLANDGFVAELISNTRVSFTGSERDALVGGLSSGAMTRAAVLRRIVENERFVRAKRNEAFVMMQYFGYLRRDPDESGYQFWLNKLNQFNGNFEQAEMVRAFLISGEYRQRFGP